MTTKINGEVKSYPLPLSRLELTLWTDVQALKRHALQSGAQLTQIYIKGSPKPANALVGEEDLIRVLESMQKVVIGRQPKNPRPVHTWLQKTDLKANQIIINSPGGRVEITRSSQAPEKMIK